MDVCYKENLKAIQSAKIKLYGEGKTSDFKRDRQSHRQTAGKTQPLKEVLSPEYYFLYEQTKRASTC